MIFKPYLPDSNFKIISSTFQEESKFTLEYTTALTRGFSKGLLATGDSIALEYAAVNVSSRIALKYFKAALKGVGKGVLDIGNFIIHPIEHLKPMAAIICDSQVVAAKNSTPILSKWVQIDPQIYHSAEHRMTKRLLAIEQNGQEFLHHSGLGNEKDVKATLKERTWTPLRALSSTSRWKSFFC